MSVAEAEGLTLTAEELHCLASLAGLTQVTGLGPMPFADLPEAEPLLWGTAARSLDARDLPDAQVETALGVVKFPEFTAAVQRGGLGGIGVRAFWAAGGRAVELRRVAAFDYLLIVFDAGGLPDRVLAAAQLGGAPNGAVPASGARLARTALLAALGGSPTPELPALDEASLWEVTWMAGGDEPEGGVVSWLDAGAAGAWRVEPDESAGEDPQGLVVLEPVARGVLAQELREALDA